MVEPMYSPWGTVDQCKILYPGVFEVATARHGGIMVRREIVNDILSKEAQEIGFVSGRYYCFEEDCDAAVVLRELLDQRFIEPCMNSTLNADEYNACIDGMLQAFYPKYWAAYENRLKNGTLAEKVKPVAHKEREEAR